MVRLTEDSFEETEQVHVIARWIGRLELFVPAAIGQSFGMAGSTGCERIGQLFPAQHVAEAQQDFVPGCLADNNAPCTHQSMNATSNIHAFCCRNIALS